MRERERTRQLLQGERERDQIRDQDFKISDYKITPTISLNEVGKDVMKYKIIKKMK